MQLYTARVCPYAHRTRLTLLEKGLTFEHIEIDFKNKPAQFLEVSPYGKVPAIVHNGQTIYESAIINEYLEEVFPEPRLMPVDPALRAKARIWIHYCDEYFTTDHYALLKNQDPARHQTLLEKAERCFRFVEREGLDTLSGTGAYWLGDQVSLVDLAWYPFFERLPAWLHYRGLRLPKDCPRLADWINTMSKRDSARQIANTPDYYVEHYAGYAQSVLAA
ncbi:MAG: glutathione S-transferase family protein [Gammaproteobacteria bacterium]|nr:glutathione S-transferase family protein [Gammaproteobacteria bacterium]